MADFGKHLKIIIDEMCRRVGTKTEDVDFSDNEWYTRHEWTKKEQDDFLDWLTEYLWDNAEARKELMTVPMRRKPHLRKASREFGFMWGWKFPTGAKDG